MTISTITELYENAQPIKVITYDCIFHLLKIQATSYLTSAPKPIKLNLLTPTTSHCQSARKALASTTEWVDL